MLTSKYDYEKVANRSYQTMKSYWIPMNEANRSYYIFQTIDQMYPEITLKDALHLHALANVIFSTIEKYEREES